MTLGEKIQYHRKQQGLSQDELGQLLLVSRQTISLWEMNKTLPTVDNLLRLKEIFSVSVDELLSDTPVETSTQDQPKETYTFQYTPDDMKSINRHVIKPFLRRLVVGLILFIFLLCAYNSNEFIGFWIGCFLTLILLALRAFFITRKSLKMSSADACNRVYRYDVYEDRLTLEITDDHGIVKTQRVNFSEVQKVEHFKHFLLLTYGGQLYIIKKDVLTADSLLYTLCAKKPSAANAPVMKSAHRVLSIVLFVASICCPWGALVVGGVAGDMTNQLMDETMWSCLLFLPIPIASIVFGIVMKRKGHSLGRMNIIGGGIMAFLLLTFGMFFFSVPENRHDPEPIFRAEELLDIDIPTHSQINTFYDMESTNGHTHSSSTVYFDEAVAEAFEQQLTQDDKWLSPLPNSLMGIAASSYILPTEYHIIYNVQTDQFNQLPQENGTYRFINVTYRCEDNVMTIKDYEIEYKKQ